MEREAKRIPDESIVSATEVKDLVVYCLYCDTEYGVDRASCPTCGLEQQEETVKPRRPSDYYYSKNTETNSSFTCFGRLPHEIKDLIWKHALPGPRIIPLRFRNGNRNQNDRPSTETPSLPGRIPMSLACQESREVFLEYYSLMFDDPSQGWGNLPAQEWFHYDTDTLYIDNLGRRLDNYLCDLQEFQYAEYLAFTDYPRPVIKLRPPPRILSNRHDMPDQKIIHWLSLFLSPIIMDEDMVPFEAVTNVIRRYPLENCHESLAYIKLQDIDASLEFYDQPYKPSNVQKFLKKQKDYAIKLMKLNPASKYGLESQRKERLLEQEFQDMIGYDDDVFNSTNPDKPPCRKVVFYEIPTLQQKILTTVSMKDKLEEAKARFYIKRARYLKKKAKKVTTGPTCSQPQ